MNVYFVGLFVLMLVSLCIVLLPLWWVQKNKGNIKALDNVTLIKARIAEIEQEGEQGLLGEHEQQQAIKELKLALVQEQTASSEERSERLGLGWPVMLVLLIAIGWLGFEVSEWHKIEDQQLALARFSELSNRVVVEADPSIQREDLEDFALGIRQQVFNRPDDHRGWLLLGRVHASLNQMEAALQAYAKGYQLAPNNPGIIRSYAEALLFSGDPTNLRTASKLLGRLLETQPDDSRATGMLAVTIEQLGDKKRALQLWKQLLANMDPQDKAYAAITDKIASLDETQKAVQIRVEVAKSLRSALPQQGFLFVFAVGVEGGNRMPAAVRKIPLGEFPVNVTLDRGAAMMPNYTLAQLSRARLVARVSADENVMLQPGELQGEQLIELQNGLQQAQITIDQEIQ